ncbi:MAG: RNA polymerase sigma factor [Planctomycetota bacterium]
MAEQSLEELYQEEAVRLYAWARLNIRAQHRHRLSAEDIAQETWFRAADRFSTFDPTTRPFRAWIFSIAKNVLAEAMRQVHRRGRVRLDEGRTTLALEREQAAHSSSGVATRLARDEAVRAFLDRIERADLLDRQIFVLHVLEGHTIPEVAERLQLGAEATSKRWQRWRQRLRALGPPPELLPKSGEQ